MDIRTSWSPGHKRTHSLELQRANLIAKLAKFNAKTVNAVCDRLMVGASAQTRMARTGIAKELGRVTNLRPQPPRNRKTALETDR
jgi:hypothetical protein